MALRPILTFEHPALREKAKKVSRVDTSIQRLIDDLSETMLDAPGAGLPVGVHVAARPGREDLILAVMAAVEGALSGSVDYPRVPTALQTGLGPRDAG